MLLFLSAFILHFTILTIWLLVAPSLTLLSPCLPLLMIDIPAGLCADAFLGYFSRALGMQIITYGILDYVGWRLPTYR